MVNKMTGFIRLEYFSFLLRFYLTKKKRKKNYLMKILYLYILKNSFLCIVLWKIGGKGLQKKKE